MPAKKFYAQKKKKFRLYIKITADNIIGVSD